MSFVRNNERGGVVTAFAHHAANRPFAALDICRITKFLEDFKRSALPRNEWVKSGYWWTFALAQQKWGAPLPPHRRFDLAQRVQAKATAKRFVYGNIRLSGERILVDVHHRKNSKPRCGQCRRSGPTYDTRTPIDVGCRRLLWVGRERKEKTLEGFFDLFETSVKEHLRFVCSDMWKPYLNVIADRAGHALNILDRYHVMATLNKKVDKVRAEETRQLKQDGYEPILKHSRWCLLKRPKNRTKKQTTKMRDLMKYNLRTMCAYLMKEDFQQFWTYHGAAWAGKFLDGWCMRAMRSQLAPMKEMAGTLRRHRELLLNWFAAKGELFSGSVEGINTKAKVALRKSYGFKTDKVYETVLYHELGRLPEHKRAHQFC